MNRRLSKGHPLRESLERLWRYTYPGVMLNYLRELADTLVTPGLDCQQLPAKVRRAVVDAVNGNIRVLITRRRGYKNFRALLFKAIRRRPDRH